MQANNPELYAQWREKHFRFESSVILFAEKWAELMEPLIKDGKKLSKIAQSTRLKSGSEGKDINFERCAVSHLYRFWVHGPALLRWYKSRIPNQTCRQCAHEFGESNFDGSC